MLLAELLGRVELRELLDPQVIASTAAQLQHLSEDRAARDAEAVADLLRMLGPLTEAEVVERCTADDVGGWLEGLRESKRALTVSFAGQTWWVAIEDIGLLRDGVGVAVPVGVPLTFTEGVDDPLGELLGRYARTRAPFTTNEAATRFGLGQRVTADVLGRMAIDGKLVRGEFTDTTEAGDQWCDANVLKILRRRSLAALRAQVEPVSTTRLCAVPSRVAAGRTRAGLRHRRARIGGRPAGRGADTGIGGRTAGVRRSSPRLPARDAR